tara:strand:+ start:428 stop:931 length:504 start_codon:yes stop_codon:yes gene_type:complete
MAKGLSMTGAGGDSISGIKEIDKALSKLEKKINKKVMKKAMRKTVAEYRKAVRKRTPKRRGTLRKSITTDVKMMKKFFIKGRMYFGRKAGRNGWHAHLVEHGTGERTVIDKWGLVAKGIRQRRRKMNVGSMPATHMADEGFDITTPQAKRIFQKALAKTIREVRAVN